MSFISTPPRRKTVVGKPAFVVKLALKIRYRPAASWEQPLDRPQINVIFEGPAIDSGVSVHDLNEVLNGLQDAVRLMVAHLSGAKTRGRPPEWLRRQSALRLQAVFPGSFGAALSLSPPDRPSAAENYGAQAMDAIFSWGAADNPDLPDLVVNRLNDIGTRMSPEIRMIRFDDPSSDRQFTIARTPRQRQPAPPRQHEIVEAMALLYGRLLEVNWNAGTAQLHSYDAPIVALRFESSLNESMRLLATRFVKVTGNAYSADGEQWNTVAVHEISDEPSEIDDFYARPPKVFDPAQATGFYQHDANDPVDINEFILTIHQGRDL